MLLHACGGFPGASSRSRGSPGASRGLDGQAGLGHPPWRGGGGLAQAEACLQRAEAGCLGEFGLLY